MQGKAELHDSIGKHLPAGVIGEDSPLHQVTLLQLSTHTSRLPRLPADLGEGASNEDPYAHYSRERLFRYLGQFKEADFENRGEYAYSNLGIGLLGELLAIINETEYEDLMKEGIIDPTKVTRFALQNASSVSSLLLTTEAMIAEKPREKEDMPPMPPGGGMGGMAA